ncbi:hypothetical protein LLG95_07005 [bacterium]|nr:hypothetical protein [bacterium]
MMRQLNISIVKLAALFGLMAFCIGMGGCDGHEPMAPDTLFSEKGTYTAPSERLSVQVKTAGKGEMRYRFVFKSGAADEYKTFPAGKEWFMCWDSRDRLWLHVTDNITCYWYPPDIGTTMIEHKMTPPQASDLALMPKTFKDKLPDKLKHAAAPTPRARRTQ